MYTNADALMKFMVLSSLFLVLGLPLNASSFTSDSDTLRYRVDRNYPPLAITKAQFKEAVTIADINRYFKPSWVEEYISVEVSALYNGQLKSVKGPDGILTKEQKDFIWQVASSGEIAVHVHYMPDNTLSHNDPKDINFTFLIEPDNGATFVGGHNELLQYFKENAIDKIENTGFTDQTLASVLFTINEAGEVVNAHVFQPSEDEATDDLLLEAVCNMPIWKPAEYDDGTRVSQEFALNIGNMESCLMNFMNIRR